jgi:two-component system, NarL family, nitrate/nitrite response regulator NarL
MIRVLIVEEVRAIREMIAAVLCAQADMEVVGQAANLHEIQPSVKRCDVVLVNAMHHDSLSSLVFNIRALAADVKVVVMGLAQATGLTRQGVDAGTAAQVVSESPLPELLRTIRSICKGGRSLASNYLHEPNNYISALPSATDAVPHASLRLLTRREREVLSLVQQGLTNQEIARYLVIELGTVKNHVHRILRKLNIASRRETVHLNYQPVGFPRMEPVAAGLLSN